VSPRDTDPLTVDADDLAAALFYVYGNVTRRGPSIGPDRPGPREGHRPMSFWQEDAHIVLAELGTMGPPPSRPRTSDRLVSLLLAALSGALVTAVIFAVFR
jgi:hypothetical protein